LYCRFRQGEKKRRNLRNRVTSLRKVNSSYGTKASFLSIGGSEGCPTPWFVDKLSGLQVCHAECGTQLSVAFTCSGHVIIIFLNTVQNLKSK
jgi:hypothetical protein